MIHDSYTCNAFENMANRPFPTQRLAGSNFTAPEEANFVGAKGDDAIGLAEVGPCPEECRPRNHKDWLIC